MNIPLDAFLHDSCKEKEESPSNLPAVVSQSENTSLDFPDSQQADIDRRMVFEKTGKEPAHPADTERRSYRGFSGISAPWDYSEFD
jgi:hypothetical protein